MTEPARPLPAESDVVVIGAGVAGAATVWALRQGGIRALVLERANALGQGASGRSAEMIREQSDDPSHSALVTRGAELHRSGRLGPFRQTGSFLIGSGEQDAADHVPFARGSGRFHAGDGVTDAKALLEILLEGVDVRLGVSVKELRPSGTATRTVTTHGDVTAPVVVLAAGAWAGRLGSLPLTPLKRHVFLTEPRPADEEWPYVWDLAAGFYFRAHGDHLLTCACDEIEGAPGDVAVEDGAAEELLTKALASQPGLAPLRLESRWAGQRTFAPDRRFVLGWDPRWRGRFWVAGLGGHGITAAPALGELAARMIAAGPDAPPPPEAEPLAPGRLLD